MARHRTSRSPSPAGSHISSRRGHRDDDRSRRDEPRDHRRRSRSPDVRRYHGRETGQENHPDRCDEQRRHRDRDRDYDRRRDRSIDRRDEDRHRSDRHRDSYRDRRRSRDRDRSPPRHRDRDRDRERDRDAPRRDDRDRDGRRDRDHRDRRPDSPRRPDSRRGGTAESSSVSGKADDNRRDAKASGTSESSKAAAPAADKKAEKLAKLEAWKRAKSAQAAASTGKKPLDDVDGKSVGTPASVASPTTATPTVASPSASNVASPATPYAGKFDPKAIAKKSAPKHHAPAVLGDLGGQPVPGQGTVASRTSTVAAKSATPGAAAKPIGKFGFGMTGSEADKGASKRKLVLDDEETSQRKLAKLPDVKLEAQDETPYENQDEAESESDDDNFAGTEEEAAAAARAAHERREERLLQQSKTDAMDVDDVKQEDGNETATGDEVKQEETKESIAETIVEPKAESKVDAMDVDDDVDPLDAFMGDLDAAPRPKKLSAGLAGLAAPMKKPKGAEMYFSDDEYDYDRENNPKNILAMANAIKKKKKDIPTIDYSKITLNTIRKDFWVEPSELTNMSEADLVDLRLELDGIKVAGKDVPKPVQKWSHCGLTQPMLNIIDKLGYDKPTPIQMQALPVIMSGRDVIGVAKTGSGKTMAFLLPMFRHIMDQEPVKDDGPIGLILTPTRELATQIFRDCKPFLQALGLKGVCAYGGPPIKDQIAELKRGCDVCVCTTGRMIDLLAANQGRVVDLKRATYLVLDEADRMFDMGFEPQVMKIFANVRPDRQTVLFSATMPRIIDSLVKKILRNPVEITVGGKSVVAAEITQIVEIKAENEKFVRLLELLGDLYKDDDDVRALIFVERQEKADELLRELLRKGYGSMSIHGGKDQVDRDSTISDFKSGVCPVLVATSVAARGLDVKQLKLVVNYDAPNHLEDYVHRAGRTGRAGNTGTAVTFVTEEQENCAPGIAKALEQSGQPVPERLDQMRKSFREKVKSGQAKDQSGFGGKGLDRLDKDREAARMRERKTHKAEGEEEEDKEETKADDEKKDKAASLVQAAASGVQSRDAPRPETAEVNIPAIKSEIRAGPAAGSTAGKGGALDKAAQAVNDINARLARAGQLRSGQSIDNKGPDAGAFHATLEINDFPQKARWAVTNRTNVAKILEATGTSITSKGIFYPAGKEPAAGQEPKLYILIEGDTEVVVSNALSELTRLLKDGAIAAAETESRAPASGRYKIT